MGVVLFYVATIGFALGIFIRAFVSLGFEEILLLLVLAFGVGVVWRKNSFAVFAPYLLYVSLLLFTVSLGIVRFTLAEYSYAQSILNSYIGTEVVLMGTVVREPDERANTTHLYIDTEDALILVYADRFGSYEYGDVVKVEGTLTLPESFETDLGRTFNYPGYLKARGVQHVIRYGEVAVVDHNAGNPLIAALLAGKHAFMRRIETLLPEPYVGLGEGLLLGVKRALGAELETVFRKTGIIHIVVLSGYNIMLVVVFVTYLLSLVIPLRLRLMFALGAIIAFALMVGLTATVVRASIMAGLVLIARALDRVYFVLRALVVTGIGMLLINPYLLAFDTGFQLSFLATLGLIVVAPEIEKRLSLVPSTVGIREFLTATLATQLFVMPILLYQIGEFSVVSVAVNVLVLPLVPVAMLTTFIAGMVGFVSTTVATPLAYLAYAPLAYIVIVAEWFAALPFASFVVPMFPFWVVPLVYAFIGFGLYRLWYGSASSNTEGDLPGWSVEEEEVVRMRTAAESRSDSAAVQPDPPIFFR